MYFVILSSPLLKRCDSIATKIDAAISSSPDIHAFMNYWKPASVAVSLTRNSRDCYYETHFNYKHSLTYEGVDVFCDTVQSFTERVCDSIATKIDAAISSSPEIHAFRQELLEACKPGNLFEGLTTRNSRECYYETHFNYKVFQLDIK